MMISLAFCHKGAKVLACCLVLGFLLATAEASNDICTISTVTTTEVVSVTATVFSVTTDPEETGIATSTKRSNPWLKRLFSHPNVYLQGETTFDVVTVTADAPTNIVTVSCGPSTETTLTSTAVEPTTALPTETTTVVETTSTATTEPTASETSQATTTIAPETTTTVSSETTTSTTTAETILPTTTDVTATPEPTESTTTENTSPSTTTDVETPTTTSVARCDGQSRYMSLVSDYYAFNDAAQVCASFGYGLAKISSIKEIKDANDIMNECGVQRAWIKSSSANTVHPPDCYAINQDTSYEPLDCNHTKLQVLCAFP